MTKTFKIDYDLTRLNDDEFLALKDAVYEEAMRRAEIAEAKHYALAYAGEPIRQSLPFDPEGEW
jgi:hypothetical protein